MAIAIGESLREARLAQGLELGDVEARIKIRPRYLRALEAEDWDALPGDAYVRGFLRTYGDFLGLDGLGLVEEYRWIAPPPEPEHPAESLIERPRRFTAAGISLSRGARAGRG